MSESVADGAQEPVVDEAAEAAAPATDFEAEATEFKKRFAGSQKALTDALNAKRALEAETETLRKFKAEAERANMTELERLTAERDEARRETAAAQSLAERFALAAKFPQSFATLGAAMPTDEEVLTSLEARLTASAIAPEETEPEPRIDPNNPRKPVGSPVPTGATQAEAWWDALRQGAGAEG